MMRPLRRGNSEHGVTGNLVCPCGGKHFAVRADEEKNKAHIRCSACGREAVLFDATRHGWDGFVCHMPVEEMPEKGIVCEACGETSFYITVSIRSQGRDDFVQESQLTDSEGNALSEEDWADAFEWIRVDLECAGCGSRQLCWLDRETM